MNNPTNLTRAMVVSVALGAGCLSGQSNSPGITIPQGTAIVVRTIDPIDSKKADLNRDYAASLADPITVDGVQVAPQGSNAVLRIGAAQSAKPLWGRASLKLRLTAITVNGQRISVESGDVTSQSGSQGAKAAKHAGVGAAAGAGIGAIAGGGFGAAIGAGIGAAAGATTGAVTGQRVQVAAETRLTFTLTTPALLPVKASEQAPAPIAPPPPPQE